MRASELPRGALVEYQVNAHTGRVGYEHVASDDDDDDEEPEAQYAQGETWQTCSTRHGHGSRAAIFVSGDHAVTSPEVEKVLSRAVTVRAYHTSSVDPAQSDIIRRIEASGACWTGVPVLEVQDGNGHSYNLALEVFGA